MNQTRKRGRPPTFRMEDRRKFAALIRQHGIRGAQRVSEVSICPETLIKIAREFQITLKTGRREKKSA